MARLKHAAGPRDSEITSGRPSPADLIRRAAGVTGLAEDLAPWAWVPQLIGFLVRDPG
jgi:hypothetical protein